MSETILVKEPLSREMIDSGRVLLAYLESKEWSPDCAFWLFDEDRGRWHLILSSSDVETKGPRFALNVVNELLKERQDLDLTLRDILVTPSHDKLVAAIHRHRIPSGTRIRGSGLDGEYISDAYIYRS